MANPYDFVNAINSTKENMFEFEHEAENDYVPYIVNRTLSYHVDTLMLANDVNLLHHMPKKQQFRYLLNSVRRGKRFAKWAKPKPNNLDIIMEWYKCGRRAAESYAALLSDADILDMERKMNKGQDQNAPTRSDAKKHK